MRPAPLVFLLRRDYAAAFEAIAPFENYSYRFGVDAVLFLENSRRKRFRCVRVFDGDRRLHHDRPRIEIFVDEMHRTSRNFRTMLERLALGFEAGEGREERGVDIQDAVGESRHKVGGYEPHVAGKAD